MVRSGFRTREGKGEERLPVGKCGKCGQETYRVPAGAWLHWGTLAEECAREDGTEGVSDGQEGTMS